jgi:hypothetical protein
MISCSLQPLYPRGKSPRYQLERRLGGPQSRSEHCGVKSGCPFCVRSLYRLNHSDPYLNWKPFYGFTVLCNALPRILSASIYLERSQMCEIPYYKGEMAERKRVYGWSDHVYGLETWIRLTRWRFFHSFLKTDNPKLYASLNSDEAYL